MERDKTYIGWGWISINRYIMRVFVIIATDVISEMTIKPLLNILNETYSFE